MSPDTQTFHPVTKDTPAEWPRFSIGELVALAGHTVRVRRVTESDVIVRPVGNWPPLVPGRTVTLKNVEMTVRKVDKNDIVLRPVKRSAEQEAAEEQAAIEERLVALRELAAEEG